MRKFTVILIALLCAVAANARERVGLVLSGGGAKGVAHIGLIQALEENDIPIDYITGTSMGAIVGGLYAAGYSPAEMMELIASPMFVNAAAGEINPDYRYYLTAPQPSPRLFSFSLGNDSVAKSVPYSLISPIPMNFAFMEVFGQATQACGGNFNHLFVPLRTVSSNIEAQRPEVARSGQLADAVRASMSFPIVFSPIEINDTLHYDGGIFDNFPVSTMKRDFNPDFTIGADVHTDVKSYPNALNQITDLVTRPQSYEVPAADGMRIHMDLHEYSLLDYAKSQAIYEVGYRRGLEMVDSIKSRTSARRPAKEVRARREAFKASFKPMEFARVECTGGKPTQNAFIEAQFPKKNFDLNSARNGFYRSISGGAMQNLMPTAEYVDSSYVLKLKAYPKSNWTVGAGGYISSSTTSMIYGSVAYKALNQRALNGSLSAWVGQSYLAAELMASIRFGAALPYTLSLQGVVSKHIYNQNERVFFNLNEPKFVKNFQAFARAYLLQMACGPHAAASLSAGYGMERVKFAVDNGSHLQHTLKLGQLALRYDYNTLNAYDFPTSGLEIHASGMGLLGQKPDRWLQLRGQARKYWSTSRRFAIGLEGEVLVSGRKPSDVYEIAIAEAPAYRPTASCFNSFNPSFHAYSFLGAGITPVYKITQQLQLRGTFHIFAPWQRLSADEMGRTVLSAKVPSPEFLGEIQAVANLKYVNVCAYANYRTGQRNDNGWHVGLTIGIFALAPDFLK